MSQDDFFWIPGATDECEALLNKLITKKTIHDLLADEFKSGSQSRSDVTNEQFALLRAYYPTILPSDLFKEYSTSMLRLKKARKSARKLLRASASYARMLRVVNDRLQNIDDLKENDPDWPGAFMPFLQQLADISFTKADKEALEVLSSFIRKCKAPSTPVDGLSSKRSRCAVDVKNYREETLTQEDPGEETLSQEAPDEETLSQEEPDEGTPVQEVQEQIEGDDDGDGSDDSDSDDSESDSDDSDDGEEGSPQPWRMAYDEIAFPRCADESIVNTCCINLLKVLGPLIDSNSSSWTTAHLSFTAQFRNGKYTAMTDGALFSKNKSIVQAIVEVKPMICWSIRDSVRKQEASEIVAWIKNSTGNGLPKLCGQ